MERKFNERSNPFVTFILTILFVLSAVAADGQSVGTLSANFEGIGYSGKTPPDPVIAVGPNHVVEVVNSEFVAFTKDGTRTIVYSSNLSDFFNDHSDNIYDCKVVFDQYSQRWVLLTLADNGSSTGYYLLAVSQGTDPNPSSWYKYKLDASLDVNQASGLRADYPGLGYDANCVYITSNQYAFGVGGTFQYAKIRILDKSGIYSGQTPTAPFTDFVKMKDADGTTTSFTIKPAQQFGSSSVYYLVNTKKNGGSSITL